jgi:hypothetical protein
MTLTQAKMFALMTGQVEFSEEQLILFKKGLNSLVILGAWTLWKHHNRCLLLMVLLLVGLEL